MDIMVIEIIKDYQFNEEELIEKGNEVEDNIFDLQTQTGSYGLGYFYSIRWIINIVEEKIEVTFFKRNRASSEVKILDRNNPNVSFGDYWRPYDRVNIRLCASFDSRQLILNGLRCARRHPSSSTWSCARYDNIVVTSW